PNVLDGRKWVYYQSPVYEIDEQEALCFDDALEKMEKKYLPCQEEFYILSNSIIK
ncbi:MAG: N-acetyltransferase, partial [Tissierellia bacterium]|nr:N-acetyltransferase [Tissierellia bacterium]